MEIEPYPQQQTQTELSTIYPVLSNEEEIQQRKKLLKGNSIIWVYADLIEIINENNIEREKYWNYREIFDIKENQFRYNFAQQFKNLESGKLFMKCKLCDYKCNYYLKSRSCPEMEKHLVNKHQSIVADFPIRERKPNASFVTTDEFVAKANALLTAFVVTSHSSFNSINNYYFQQLLNHLNKNYIVPSKSLFSSSMIPVYTERAKTLIKKELNKINFASFTLDGWSALYTQKQFFSLTIHYIFNNQLISRILKLTETKEKHSSANISEFINKSFEEWDLKRLGKCLIVTDNAPNVIAGVDESGKQSLGCFCHLFDIIIDTISDKCKVFNYLLNKCQKINVKFRNKNELAIALEVVQN